MRVIFGGNPHLKNEIADSRTYGLLLRPLPRLALTVDWVSIDIEQPIQQVGADDLLESCYDTPGYPSVDCGRITRGAGGHVESIQTGYANEGSFKFHGLMSTLDYSFDVPFAPTAGAWGTLDLKLNHFFNDLLEISSFAFQGVVTDSKEKGVITLGWEKSWAHVQWQARFVGPAVFGHGLPANLADYQGVGGWWVHNLTLGCSPISNLSLQLVVDNVFDREMPFPLPATLGGPAGE